MPDSRLTLGPGGHAEQTPGRGIGHFHLSFGIDDQHRIGKRIDGGLAGPLGPQQLGELRLAIIAQMPRAMRLNAWASWPSSSSEETGTT